MLSNVMLVFAGAALATLYFLLKNRRKLPNLEIDIDALPPIAEGLELLAGLTSGSVAKGNRCRILQNGAFYDAIAQDIEQARRTIHLETFVWTRGNIERRFVELLCRKAREGVKVRVMIDALGGSSADLQQLRKLKECVELSLYCRPRWWNLRRFNHRTHRKLLIVDGTIGYTFGHGFADQWLGDGEDRDHWRDTAVRVEGPAVDALQSVFIENWIEESNHVPSDAGCFPTSQPLGTCDAHVVSSASGDAISKVAVLYTVAIACARREVIIQNPYFAPDDELCGMLGKMVKRGVAVHLMVPGHNTDSPFVRRAGCHLYEPLLRAGVHVYEFQPTLLHQKIVIVDEVWSHIGSTNFDARSLALNEEVGIGILDRNIALDLKTAFQQDLKRSQKLDLATWNRRPASHRLFEWFAYQVHDQL